MDDLPPYTDPPFPVPEDQRITVFDWMVLTCYPAEFKKQAHLAELESLPTGPDSVAAQPRDLRSGVAGLQID